MKNHANCLIEIVQHREQNIEHVWIYISEHRIKCSSIAGVLEHPIACVQHRSMWLGIMPSDYYVPNSAVVLSLNPLDPTELNAIYMTFPCDINTNMSTIFWTCIRIQSKVAMYAFSRPTQILLHLEEYVSFFVMC